MTGLKWMRLLPIELAMKCCLATLACALTVLSSVGAQRIEDAYIAPINHFMFKMVLPDGVVREFQRDPARPAGLVGADGWEGNLSDDGTIAIRRKEGGVVQESFEFFRGRLVFHSQGGLEKRFPYDAPRAAPASSFTPLDIVTFADEREDSLAYSRRELEMKWAETGRLAFPYSNPNHSGALFAELTLMALAGVFACRRRRAAAAIAAVAALCAICTMLSGSRGALLGLASGVAAVLLFRIGRLVRSRVFLGIVAVIVVVVTAWLALGGAANLMRGFTSTGALDWSNAIRLDMWKAAPQMMVAAPWGWGGVRVGQAYLDWYQPLDALCLTGSLMNDHLTVMVQVGWPWRFGYVFALAFVLFSGFLAAWRCGVAAPLAVWAAFAVMSWFNPLYLEWGLWIAPAIALAMLFRVLARSPKSAFAAAGAAVCVAGAVISALVWTGSGDSGKLECPQIHVDGRRIAINGRNPKIWVVDDGRGALGGLLFGKDIRSFYAADRSLPAIGYVRDIADLPPNGIDRLVLAGKAGNDWLLELSENAASRKNLPKSVVFISPPFLPSEVPEGVRVLCRPRIIVGEFAARYRDEYAKPPDWVTVVPGMEKYLLLWPQYVIGG